MIILMSAKRDRPKGYEKCIMNLIIVDEKLRKIIRRKIIELNKIESATYYLFCLTVYESLKKAEVFAISEVTIQRCCNMLFKGRFKNEDKETQIIKETYLKYEREARSPTGLMRNYLLD